MRRSITLLVVPIAAVALLLAGCGDDDSEGSRGNGRIPAVATTTHIADFVRNVGGDRVEVDQLLDPNVDPHDYEFSPSDAEAVADSDIVFKAGFDLDTWLDELIDNAGGERPVIDTSEGVETIAFEGEEEHEDEEEGGEDPGEDAHIWFDPRNVALIIDNIADALTHLDPDSAEIYRSNADAYKAEVEAMDQRVEEIFSACAPGELKLVTSHDAFGYLARRYDLQILGAVIPGTDTTAETSAGELSDLIELIEEEDVRAIFSETSVNTELEDQVAEETGATVVDELYADTLGPEGSGAETYIAMMEYNANAIVDGLGCETT